MILTEYCPTTEIQRMEQELMDFDLKGDDIEAYNNRVTESKKCNFFKDRACDLCIEPIQHGSRTDYKGFMLKALMIGEAIKGRETARNNYHHSIT
ncbi:hypothetical protein Tco_1236151 [Tanacetum coccineum]